MNKKELWKKILHFVITVLTAIGTTSCTDTKKETTFTCGFLFFVGVAGFEPTTPCSQSRCANRTALHPETSLIDLSLLSDSNQRPRDYKSRALAN